MDQAEREAKALYPENSRPYDPEKDDTVSWSDWGKMIGVGAYGVAEGVSAITEKVTGKGREEREYFSKKGEELKQGIGPAGQRAMDASVIPQDGRTTVLDEGVGRSVAAKGLVALPSLIASIIPGGLVGRGLMIAGTGAAKAGVVGGAVAKGTGAALDAGEVVSRIYETVDKMSDEELSEQSDVYKGYLSMMPPDQARAKFREDMVGIRPYVVGAISYLTGGIEGKAGAIAGGAAKKGFVKGVKEGAPAEALQEGAVAGASEVTTQEALSQFLLQPENWLSVLNNTVEGAGMGAVVGGGVGGVANIGGKSNPTATPAGNAPNVTAPATPQQGQTSTAKATATTPTVVPEVGPDPAQAAALPADPFADTFANPATPPAAKAPAAPPAAKAPAPAAPAPAAPAPSPTLEQERRLTAEGQDLPATARPEEPLPPGWGPGEPAPAPSTDVDESQLFQPTPKAAPAPAPAPKAAPPAKAAPAPAEPDLFAQPPAARPTTAPPATPAPEPAPVEPTPDDPRTMVAAPEQMGPKAAAVWESIQAANPQQPPAPVEPTTAPEPAPAEAPAPVTPPGTGPKAAAVVQKAKSKTNPPAPEPAAEVSLFDAPAPKPAEAKAPEPPKPVTEVEEIDAFGDATGRKLLMQGRTEIGVIEKDGKRRLYNPEQMRAAREEAFAAEASARAEERRIAEEAKRNEQKLTSKKKGKAKVDEVKAKKEAEKAAKKAEKEAAKAAKAPKVAKAPEPAKTPEEIEREKELAELIATQDKDISLMGGMSLSEPGSAEKLAAVSDGTPKSGAMGVRTGTGIKPGAKASGGKIATQEEIKAPETFEKAKAALDVAKEREKARKEQEEGRKFREKAEAAGQSAEATASREEGALQREIAKIREEYEANGLKVPYDRIVRAAKTNIEKRAAKNAAAAEARVAVPTDLVTQAEKASRKADTPAGKPEPKMAENLPPAARKLFDPEPLVSDEEIADEPSVDVKAADRPRKRWQVMSDAEMEGLMPFARVINDLRKFLNDLSDEQHAILRKHLGGRSGWDPQGAPADTMEPERLKAEYQRAIMMGDDYTFDGMAHDPKQRLPIPQKIFPSVKRRAALTSPAFGTSGDILQVTDVGSLLSTINIKNFPGVSAGIARLMVTRLRALAKDVQVSVVEADAMVDWYRDQTGEDASPAGLYVHKTDEILLTDETMVNADGFRDSVIIHEITHAAYAKVLDADFQARSDLERLRIMTWRALTLQGMADEDMPYGVSAESPHEFLAEALSDPEFQRLLTTVQAPADIAARYPRDNISSMWDWLIASIRRALGMPPGSTDALSATLKITERLDKEATQNGRKPPDAQLSFQFNLKTRAASLLSENLQKRILDQREMAPNVGTPRALAVRTFDNISRLADTYFGNENNPVRIIAETREKIRVAAQNHLKRSEPVIAKLYALQKKYEKTGEWESFTKLQHDANILDLHPDAPLLMSAKNAHIGKGLMSAQARDAWSDLAQRYNALPPDLKQAWGEATTYFATQQNEMAFKLLRNRVIAALVKEDMSAADLDALARRVFDRTATDADKKLIGEDAYEGIMRVDQLKKINGPYMPQMRRGGFVVTASKPVPVPKNGKAIEPNLIEFATGDEAMKFASQMWEDHGFKAVPKRVVIDPKTGNTTAVDDDGTVVKLTKADIDVVTRFRVEVQNRHVEFFATEADARAMAADLNKEGFENVSAEKKKFEREGRQDLMSEQMRSLMKRIEQGRLYKELGAEQRKEVVSALSDLSFQMLGATRIQSRRLPRRHVLGASRDVTLNTLEYAQSVAGYIAKLDHQPTIDTALTSMRKSIEEGRSRDYDKGVQIGRSVIANEVEKRVTEPADLSLSKYEAGVQRILRVSFLDKLFSPAYSVINATQVITNTLPMLAGRHGWGSTTRAMTDAFRIIGGGRNLSTGAGNIGRAAKGKEQTDLLVPLRDRLAKQSPAYAQLFDFMVERGMIQGDAGLEIARELQRATGAWGAIDKALNYGEGLARALPEAVEVNNRMATAVATYNLERAKGLDHDAATQRAYDMVNRTQFNYSATNAPAFMHHPLARLALQFKKYAQGQYQLIGETVGQALHGQTPQDRREAMKALANWAAVTTVMAGALGLPTEPIKYLLLATSPVTGYTMEDFERNVREVAAGYLGADLGEVLTRGASRALPGGLAFDLNERIGMQDLTTRGAPRSLQSHDLQAWLFQQSAGAPAGLALDWVQGVNALASGDLQKAAEKLIPMKFAVDLLSTYKGMTEGKVSDRTQRTTMDPYNAAEAGLKALGLKPAREAETYERDSAFNDRRVAQSRERSGLVSKWLAASKSEKAKAWADIQRFNKGRPKEAQISMSQLQSALKRREREEKGGVIKSGTRVLKQDRGFYDQGAVYNTAR